MQYSPKNHFTFFISILLCLFITAFFTNCSSERAAWELAKTNDNITDYYRYLKKYPQGEHAPEARLRIEALWEEQAFTFARQEDTIKAYQKFLQEYPSGTLFQKAINRMEELTFQNTKGENTIPAYQQFLSQFPGGLYYKKARDRINELLKYRHPLLKNITDVKLMITQDFKNIKDFQLPVKSIIEGPLWMSGLNIGNDTEKEEKDRIIIKISINGTPLKKKYSLFGTPFGGSHRFTGARTWGSIIIVQGNRPLLKKNFNGTVKPLNSISMSDFQEPRDAPFEWTLFLPDSFIQKYYEFICELFGYHILFPTLKSPRKSLIGFKGLNWDTSLFLLAIDAILKFKDTHTYKRLKDSLKYLEPRFKERLAATLGRYNDTQAVPLLIELLKDGYSIVKEAALHSLSKLTGENFGTDYITWKNWWQKKEQ